MSKTIGELAPHHQVSTSRATSSIPQSDMEHIHYNSRALVKCEASYLGAATPILTTQPPGIIHEPLDVICHNTQLPTIPQAPTKPVRLYIYHSAILIQILYGDMAGQMVYYPIQNLYCSAGLLPHTDENGQYYFKTLEEQTSPDYNLRPVFSVVLRESINKKILQCHAFAVINRHVARLLVKATAVAFKDKQGWNQPLNIESSKILYTLNGLHESSGVITNGNVTQIDVEQSNVYYHQHWRKYLQRNAQRRMKMKVKATRSFPVVSSEQKANEDNQYQKQLESESYQDELLRSPSSASSSAVATYQGFRTDLAIGMDPDSPSVTKSASAGSSCEALKDDISRGPTHPPSVSPSESSSVSSSPTTCLQSSPQVVVIQKRRPKYPVEDDNNNNRGLLEHTPIIASNDYISRLHRGTSAGSSQASSADSLSACLENVSLNSSTYTKSSRESRSVTSRDSSHRCAKGQVDILNEHQKYTINNNIDKDCKHMSYPYPYLDIHDEGSYLHPDAFLYGTDISSTDDNTYKRHADSQQKISATSSLANGGRKSSSNEKTKTTKSKKSTSASLSESSTTSKDSMKRVVDSMKRKSTMGKCRQLL